MRQYQGHFPSFFGRKFLQRGAILGGILLVALAAFEIFNYTTTDFALTDLLGSNLRFAGFRWATILSLAFCGIDFAGLARLFTPEQTKSEPVETWYLFGAWLLAAAMNATLTWWGVAVAVRTHVPQADGTVLSQQTLLTAIPVFVAIMVGVIRILIIGTFARAGNRIFSIARDLRDGTAAKPTGMRPFPQSEREADLPRPVRPNPAPYQPVPKPEPSYHPVGMAARPHEANGNIRK